MSQDIRVIRHNIETSADPRAVLEQLRSVLRQSDISLADRLGIIAGGLRRLATKDVASAPLIQEAALDIVWPAISEPIPDGDTALFARRYQIRTMLVDLLDSLSTTERAQVRRAILTEMYTIIERGSRNPGKAAHEVIRTLGFRDDDLIASLLGDLNRDDWRGDAAFATAVLLRVPIEHRGLLKPRLLAVLQPDLIIRNSYLVYAVLQQRWLDADVIDAILRAVIATPLSANDNWINASTLIGILGALAYQRTEDLNLQRGVWTAFIALHRNHTALVMPALELNSSAISRIAESQVITDVIRWLATDVTAATGSYWRWYIRLAECNLPAQIEGWKDVGNGNAAWKTGLRNDATQNVGQESRFKTLEMKAKSWAWDIALRQGSPDVREWARPAIEGETNPYVAAEILESFAWVSDIPLWPALLELITTPFELKHDEDSGEYFRRLCAVKFARGAATWECFEALAECGLTVNGESLREVSDAFSDVAVQLARSDSTRVESELWKWANDEGHAIRCHLAVYALEAMADSDVLDSANANNLLAIANRTTLPEHARAAALNGLCELSSAAIVPLADRLKELASSDEHPTVRTAALVTLAKHRSLKLLTSDDLRETLGLEPVGQEWCLRQSYQPDDNVGYILSVCYAEEPEQFATVLANLLSTVDGEVLYSMLSAIRQKGRDNPSSVNDAVAKRILERTTPYEVETELFEVLSQISPDKLISIPWETAWTNWHMDARVALANALAIVPTPREQNLNRMVLLLEKLTGDGQFAVRRSAYRALSRHVPQAINSFVSVWASDKDRVETRKRAAEATAWTSGPEASSDLERLLVDPEPVVRAAAEQAIVENLRLRNARTYVDKIANGLRDHIDVLDLYRYGSALQAVGDDESIRSLRSRCGDVLLRPNEALWLNKVIDLVEKAWRDVTTKWPEPWIRLEGNLEELDAMLVVGGDKYDVRATLWSVPRQQLSQVGAWGGLLSMKSPKYFQLLRSSSSLESVALQVSGRTTASVILTNASADYLLIDGSGAYPEEANTQTKHIGYGEPVE